ncbi:MAG TPA: sulfur carrier protein ThiS [Candidatus Sulfotelmatobacter sp.]|nr:sulfur carrier protein ThiS [Candidatus Sulfotelmatobacter sp.]
MEVRINGKPKEVPEGLSITALLAELGLDTRYAAVALNGEVVRRADHPAVLVKEGDRIEIVHAVAGGA